jgi:hypothetical protein
MNLMTKAEKRAERLPDLWWVLNREGMPQRYVCPLATTIEIWRQRLAGREVYWKRATTIDGKWSEPACAIDRTTVINSHGQQVTLRSEMRSRIPRKVAIAECNFWNSPIGVRLRRPIKGKFA